MPGGLPHGLFWREWRRHLPQLLAASSESELKEEQRLAGRGGGRQVGFSSLSLWPSVPLPPAPESVLGRLAWCQMLDRVGMGPRLGGGKAAGGPAKAKP